MKEKGIIKFLVEQQTRLSCIIRYNNTPKVNGESVAEHSYFVAMMTMLIADYLVAEHNMKIDTLKLMKMSLLHDVEEIISGDIIKVLKTAGFKTELEKMNERSMQYLTGILESRQGQDYYDLWHETKSKASIESQLVDFADWLAVLVYSIREAHLGNKYFEEILEYGIRSFQKFRLSIPATAKLVDEITTYTKSYLSRDPLLVDDINKAVRLNPQQNKFDEEEVENEKV
jgi:5'-deoxynucleotidase YfbR-like HD superfamily hydrolase